MLPLKKQLHWSHLNNHHIHFLQSTASPPNAPGVPCRWKILDHRLSMQQYFWFRKQSHNHVRWCIRGHHSIPAQNKLRLHPPEAPEISLRTTTVLRLLVLSQRMNQSITSTGSPTSSDAASIALARSALISSSVFPRIGWLINNFFHVYLLLLCMACIG